jgi:hypothetical protein
MTARWNSKDIDKKAPNVPKVQRKEVQTVNPPPPLVSEPTEKKEKGSETWAKPRRPSAEVSKYDFKENTKRIMLSSIPEDQVDKILDAVEKILPNIIRP